MDRFLVGFSFSFKIFRILFLFDLLNVGKIGLFWVSFGLFLGFVRFEGQIYSGIWVECGK